MQGVNTWAQHMFNSFFESQNVCFDPGMSSYTGKQNSETPRDHTNAFLHWGDVLPLFSPETSYVRNVAHRDTEMTQQACLLVDVHMSGEQPLGMYVHVNDKANVL